MDQSRYAGYPRDYLALSFLSQQLPRPLSYHYSSSPFNHQECFSVPLFSFLPVVQHSIVVEAICSCRFFTVRPIGGG